MVRRGIPIGNQVVDPFGLARPAAPDAERRLREAEKDQRRFSQSAVEYLFLKEKTD
jgi:hypothetical protein